MYIWTYMACTSLTFSGDGIFDCNIFLDSVVSLNFFIAEVAQSLKRQCKHPMLLNRFSLNEFEMCTRLYITSMDKTVSCAQPESTVHCILLLCFHEIIWYSTYTHAQQMLSITIILPKTHIDQRYGFSNQSFLPASSVLYLTSRGRVQRNTMYMSCFSVCWGMYVVIKPQKL